VVTEACLDRPADVHVPDYGRPAPRGPAPSEQPPLTAAWSARRTSRSPTGGSTRPPDHRRPPPSGVLPLPGPSGMLGARRRRAGFHVRATRPQQCGGGPAATATTTVPTPPATPIRRVRRGQHPASVGSADGANATPSTYPCA